MAIALTVIIGLLQYFFLPDLRWLYYLGWDDHLYRLTFPYFDPNFTGIILSMFLLYYLQISLPLVSLFLLIPIFLTYSRSTFLALFVSLFFYLSLRFKILLIILFSLAILLLPQRFGEGTNLWRTYSIKSRFNHDFNLIQQQLTHPLNGHQLYHSASIFPNRSVTANNSFIDLFYTSGLIPLFIFFFLLRFYISHSLQPFTWLLLILGSFFNNLLFYPFVLLWLFILEFFLKDAKSTST